MTYEKRLQKIGNILVQSGGQLNFPFRFEWSFLKMRNPKNPIEAEELDHYSWSEETLHNIDLYIKNLNRFEKELLGINDV